MSTTETADREQVARDFRTNMEGTLEPAQLDAAAAAITTATQRYPATGSVASLIFYLKWQVTVTGGKRFNGNSGGVASPGGGALIGDVYTDDIQRLYRDTRSFQFTATPVYVSLIFFDGSSRVLGTFQAGAVSIVSGVGGGSGSWS